MNFEPLPVHQDPAFLGRAGMNASQTRNERLVFESHSSPLLGFKGNLSDLMRKYVKPRTDGAFSEELFHAGLFPVNRLVKLVHSLVISLLPGDPPPRDATAKGAL